MVIAAITSCTNTSNPSVMIAAGLLAKKAVEAGLTRKPWVKTSLAPGSQVVTDYLERAGLIEPLEQLGFNARRLRLHDVHRQLRPAAGGVSREISRGRSGRSAGADRQPQLRGPRPPEVRGTTSPARRWSSPTRSRAGWTSTETRAARHGQTAAGLLDDIWPTQREVGDVDRAAVESDMFRAQLRRGVRRRRELEATRGADRRPLRVGRDVTYIQQPAVLRRHDAEPPPVDEITGARALALLGDSITTDHISPAGAIKKDSPAGKLPDRARRRAAGLQLLRRPARQPRGDDPRHVRQRPPAEPARSGHRGRATASGTASRPRSTTRR